MKLVVNITRVISMLIFYKTLVILSLMGARQSPKHRLFFFSKYINVIVNIEVSIIDARNYDQRVKYNRWYRRFTTND